MNTTELRPGIYAVGVVDWNVRSFHGYTTNRGATYNAYLIVDEKIALIDTVKAPFAAELLERVREIIDPARIDYLVSNHVEMDHSGALPALMEACPIIWLHTVRRRKSFFQTMRSASITPAANVMMMRWIWRRLWRKRRSTMPIY